MIKDITEQEVRDILGKHILIVKDKEKNKKLYYNALTAAYYVESNGRMLHDKFTAHELAIAVLVYNSN